MTTHTRTCIPYQPELFRADNYFYLGHPGLSGAVEQILSLPVNDSGGSVLIHKERPNLILETSLGPESGFPWSSQVVKRFKWRGIQRFFSPFKMSKAMKSYRAALHLIEHGLDTPMPLAAAEYRWFGFVISNAYVTEPVKDFTDLKKYRDTLPDGPEGMERVLRHLAKYVLQMHDSGLWHRDLNLSNFLLISDQKELKLYLVDLNRSRIKRGLSFWRRAADLARLDLNQWQEMFFRFYCEKRFNIRLMLRTTNLFRARRRIWRNMVVRTNPLRRKIGWK